MLVGAGRYQFVEIRVLLVQAAASLLLPVQGAGYTVAAAERGEM